MTHTHHRVNPGVHGPRASDGPTNFFASVWSASREELAETNTTLFPVPHHNMNTAFLERCTDGDAALRARTSLQEQGEEVVHVEGATAGERVRHRNEFAGGQVRC